MQATVTINSSRVCYFQPSASAFIGTHPTFLNDNDNRTVATSSSSTTVKHSNMSEEYHIGEYLRNMDENRLASIISMNSLLLCIRNEVDSARNLGDEEIQLIVDEVLGDERQTRLRPEEIIRRFLRDMNENRLAALVASNRLLDYILREVPAARNLGNVEIQRIVDEYQFILRAWMTTLGQLLPRDWVVAAAREALPQLMGISDENILQGYDDLVRNGNDRATLQDQQQGQQGRAPDEIIRRHEASGTTDSPISTLTNQTSSTATGADRSLTGENNASGSVVQSVNGETIVGESRNARENRSSGSGAASRESRLSGSEPGTSTTAPSTRDSESGTATTEPSTSGSSNLN